MKVCDVVDSPTPLVYSSSQDWRLKVFKPEGEYMKFCLTYDGPLPGDKKRCLDIKHKIRTTIHLQLKDLIENHEHALGEAFGQSYQQLGKAMFFPLVISKLNMVCELDILFLRRERPGSLITKPKDEYGGDLDNRLKIFLDALRAPREVKELPLQAASEKDIFYCLLEDDALITRFQVDSRTLLGPSNEQSSKDVRLYVDVTVKVTQSTDDNRALNL